METDAAHAFDFLEGRWRARCRSPRPDGTWDEAEGTLTVSKVLDGMASLELFEGPYCGTPIKAIGLRAFDPRTQEWSHTWTDTTTPGEFHVWRGRLAEGQVALHSSWLENGHTVLSRLTWSRIEGPQRTLGEPPIDGRRPHLGTALVDRFRARGLTPSARS